MNRNSIKLIRKETDSLVNLTANMNSGSDRLQQSFHTASSFYGYQELSAIYSSWLGRRIVDLPPEEALKKGWTISCPSWEPEKIEKLNKYTEFLNLQELMLRGLKSERTFGGSVITALTDDTWGAMRNPIPDFLPGKTLLTLQMFDAWQCYASEVNLMNPLKDNYLYPESYTIGSAGMINLQSGKDNSNFITGSLVHRSRIERFGGEWMPWYERQRNMYWGASILGIAYDAIRNAGTVDNSIASLLFRASVPVMKVEDLINIVADPESRSAFLERMNILNYQMSNNNMAIIDSTEELTNLELGSISGLDPILERYYILVSAATGIPVTKLVGESAKGLTATGEGDLGNYYDMLEAYQFNRIRPHLIEIYKRWVIPSYFDELMPADFTIQFPELERESPSKKQEKDSAFIDMLSKAVDAGFIDKKIARLELLERKAFKNFTKEDLKRLETEAAENEVPLNEALDIADELYNQNPEENGDEE